MQKASGLKIGLIAALAQLTASATFIFLMKFYSKTQAGKEAWPILVPALIIAFSLEIFILFLALRQQRGAAFLLRISIAVLASWAAGLLGFLAMDVFARSPYIRPPLVAWLLGLAILFMMIKKAERT